tara:strand:+ start:308 stop:736 length:429 start_codon:yes stop_codon:yes gene_type:complete
MIVGPAAFQALASVRVAIHTKDGRAVVVVTAARQTTAPLPALIALAAIGLLDTGIATAPRVVADLVVGAAPFGTTPHTEPVGATNLTGDTIIIAATELQAKSWVLIPLAATVPLRTVTGLTAVQDSTALVPVSRHTIAVVAA